MKGAILLAGTSSGAGKSTLGAGICRFLARRGVRVAPFKAQNMALNAALTPGGAENARAQAVQAQAAGVVPEAAMNPILLKPTSEETSQVVVLGRPMTVTSDRSFLELRGELLPVVLSAFESLRSRFDVVICEGAGSLAEPNLRAGDLANMGLARVAGLPVVVVADIERGGAFAGLVGSLAILEVEDQALVRGFVLNKFRGDPAIVAPALGWLRDRTARPVLGVVPWVPGLGLDGEDSLDLDDPDQRPLRSLPPLGRDAVKVAVVRLPRISNFTDLDPLASEPGVSVRYTRSPTEVVEADLVVVPGTKATVEDLAWLRAHRLDEALRVRGARGDPVIAICGGYQMLGRRIVDPVESGLGAVEGLGLLPVETVFVPEKLRRWSEGMATWPAQTRVVGYEIRHGRVRRLGGEALIRTAEGDDGCREGSIVGTSWHGLFETDEFRRAFLRWVAEVRELDWIPGSQSFAVVREARLDRLGELVERHVDTDLLLRLIADGALRGRVATEAGALLTRRGRPLPGVGRRRLIRSPISGSTATASFPPATSILPSASFLAAPRRGCARCWPTPSTGSPPIRMSRPQPPLSPAAIGVRRRRSCP
jgi:adenosylcobyric acid synthase